MVIWIKSRDGTVNRLVDNWSPAFYVAGKQKDLMELARQINIEDLTLEEKYVSIDDYGRSQVLRVPAETTSLALKLSKLISLSTRKYRLFNVDIPAEQTYLYERDLFPLAYVEAELGNGKIKWLNLDCSGRVDYEIPPLEPIDLTVTTDSDGPIPSFNDPLKEIRVTARGEATIISSNEEGNILELVRLLKEIDPDVVYTQNGNSFLLPYLAARARRLGISSQLILGREGTPLKTSNRKGRVYASYGRVYYRPAPVRLHGRIHIDREQAFLYNDCGLEGIIEVSRVCRVPIQRCLDSTIGTSMTSLQLYHAFKRDILTPWFKALPEELKTAEELV
ncbi:MAG: 3'-5' exonuclease, partial [Candidatus Bathyarchaeia archaeon]